MNHNLPEKCVEALAMLSKEDMPRYAKRLPAERTAPSTGLESESGTCSDSSRRAFRSPRPKRRTSRPAEKRPRGDDGDSAVETDSRTAPDRRKMRCGRTSPASGTETETVASGAAGTEQCLSGPALRTEAPAGRNEALTRVAERIRHVSRASKNLKGTFVKDLNESVSELLDMAQEPASALHARHEAEKEELRQKVTALEAALATQAQHIEQLVAAVRSQQRPTAEPVAARGEDPLAQLERRLIGILDARLEALCARLPPEPIRRPPLAADKARGGAAPKPPATVAGVPGGSWPALGAAKEAARQATIPSVPAHAVSRESRKRKRGNRRSAAQRRRPPTPCPPPPPATTSAEVPWTVVVKRGKKKERPRVAPQPAAPPRKSAPQLRLPRNAAVSLTVVPKALERGATYAQVLREVQAKVDIASLGIAGLRPRRVATGAYLFEVPGPESEAKADSLLTKLREALGGSEDVHVTRPVKTVELRVSGLDASATPEAVASAVARLGECSPDDLKVGELRVERSGLGSAWLRCPAKAAEKVLRAGRVLVGWVSAGVRLLEQRPRRCFRCLHRGHVRAQCTDECDRSGICYRCGQPGHKARQCSADPHCTICAAAGKPAKHPVGGKACVAPSVPPRPQRGAGAGAVARPQPSHPESMEIAHS